jgi:RNA polymerase sigma factor (sigma-70 family)
LGEAELDVTDEELVDRLLPVLRVAARTFVHTRWAQGNADDLVQDAWLRLCRRERAALRAWRADGGASLETWAVRVAEKGWHSLMQHERRGKRGGGLIHEEIDAMASREPSREPGAEEAVIARDLVARVASAIEDMPSRARLVFQLRFLDGLTSAEVARAMNRSPQDVFNWTFRVRERARAVRDSGE